MIFMMQKEVVDRLCAGPGTRDYGRLTLMIRARCRVERILSVGPGAFRPPPRVESSVVRLKPSPELADKIENPPLFERVVKQAFAQRRKTLRNALKGLAGEPQFDSAGIASTFRAQDLSVDEFILLANTINRSDIPP